MGKDAVCSHLNRWTATAWLYLHKLSTRWRKTLGKGRHSLPPSLLRCRMWKKAPLYKNVCLFSSCGTLGVAVCISELFAEVGINCLRGEWHFRPEGLNPLDMDFSQCVHALLDVYWEHFFIRSTSCLEREKTELRFCLLATPYIETIWDVSFVRVWSMFALQGWERLTGGAPALGVSRRARKEKEMLACWILQF